MIGHLGAATFIVGLVVFIVAGFDRDAQKDQRKHDRAMARMSRGAALVALGGLVMAGRLIFGGA